MASPQSKIVDLATQIQASTAELDGYLSANKLPTPSLALGTPLVVPLPPAVIKAQDQILCSSAELQALVAGPLGHITRILSPTVSILMLFIDLC